MKTGVDCFAGIGGFSLAMRNCGIEPKVQIEIDEYCRRVLAKNFPKAKRFGDICAVTANDLRRIKPFILCGGFPCQDVSAAGKGAGANEGERSGLWREMWRLIRITRPRWVLIENVPALRTRGIDSVLVALEALGYTAWSFVVGALHVGAPHVRQRVWIVAYAARDLRGASRNNLIRTLARASFMEHAYRATGRASGVEAGLAVASSVDGGTQLESAGALGDAKGIGDGSRSVRGGDKPQIASTSKPGFISNSNGNRLRKQSRRRSRSEGREARVVATAFQYAALAGPQGQREGLFAFPAGFGAEQYEWECSRAVKSGLGRAVDGIPGRLDRHRIKALGNAIVPRCAEVILRAILFVDELLNDKTPSRSGTP